MMGLCMSRVSSGAIAERDTEDSEDSSGNSAAVVSRREGSATPGPEEVHIVQVQTVQTKQVRVRSRFG